MTQEEREFGARMLSTLGNASRLRILECLAGGPASVREIAEAAGLKQSITSQHLAALLHAGVVICNPHGNRHIYRLRGPRVSRILKLVEEFHAAHIDSMRRIVAAHV